MIIHEIEYIDVNYLILNAIINATNNEPVLSYSIESIQILEILIKSSIFSNILFRLQNSEKIFKNNNQIFDSSFTITSL